MANTTFFGALGLAETDETLLTDVGERNVYEAAVASIEQHNAEVLDDLAFIVEGTTEDWSLTYKYAGGGRLQKLGNRTRAAEVKAGYEWSVGLPLENWGAGFAADRVTYAHMTTRDMDRTIRTIFNQDRYTMASLVLNAIFDNTSRVFVDELRGSVTLVPLANGDAVKYPPTYGTEASATANHYLTVTTDAQAFTDANNPFPAVVAKLEAQFGKPSGGSPMVIFMNAAQATRAKLLATFDPIYNRYVTPGIGSDRVELGDLPNVPGTQFGVADGAILSEWPRIPAGYLFALHLGAPRPLLRRVDMAKTGLPPGLAMVLDEVRHPFYEAEWIRRVGFGVGNRLNGVVMDLDTGSDSYTIPTIV